MSRNKSQMPGTLSPILSGNLDWFPGMDLSMPSQDEVTQACMLKVELIRVIYFGEDIGSDWRYWIWVNNTLWDSDERNLEWHEIDILNVRIFEQNVGSCESSLPVFIRIRARERDRLFNDIGFGFRIPTVRCIEQGDVQPISIPVPVEERSLFNWFNRPVAVLRFDLLLTTECISVVETKPPKL